MNFKKDGGPAFPVIVEGGVDSGLHPDRWDGMTLRDWFAGQALTGVVAACKREPTKNEIAQVATTIYAFADAMLKARETPDD